MGDFEKAITQRLQHDEAEYRAGKRVAFLDALALVTEFNLAAPQWVRDHLLTGVYRYMRGEARTLDDAFGIHRPRSWVQPKTEEQRRARDMQVAACLMVGAMLQNKKVSRFENGRGVFIDRKDLALLEAIEIAAEKLRMTESAVKRAYYNNENRANLGFSQGFKKSGIAKRKR